MNIQELTAYINQNIRNNGVQAITGDLMQNVLNSIVATLTDGANIVPGSVTRGAIAPGAVDNTPTAGSNNLITSTAVAAAIKAIQTVVLENKELTDAELQNIIKTANGLTDAVNDRIPISEKGMYNGVATLGADGRVPASQLPGFVDDVKEGYLFEGKFYRDAEHTEEIEPQGDMIYIDLVTDKEYRWGGTTFAEISESLALGETAETAYAGSKGKQNAEDIERLKTEKQDTLVSGENVKTLNGESILGPGNIEITGGGAELIPITWAELVALRDAGQLVVGGLYRLTDYEVDYSISDRMTSEPHPFDLILIAIAPNILSEECKAMLHEGDNYYSQYNRDLSAWKIWYCIDNDTTRFKWVNETNGKGIIYRMIDDNNIDCPYDFKQCKPYVDGQYKFTFYSSGNADVSVKSRCILNVKLLQQNSNNDMPRIARFLISTSSSLRLYDTIIQGAENSFEIKNELFYQNILINVYNSNFTLYSGCYRNVFINIRNCSIARAEQCIYINCTSLHMSASKSAIILNSSSISGGSSSYPSMPNENIYIVNSSNITMSKKGYGCKNITIMNNCKDIEINGDNVYIGMGCANIKLGKQNYSYGFNSVNYINIGNCCANISILINPNFSNHIASYIVFKEFCKNLSLTTTLSGSGSSDLVAKYFDNITFLQGGRDATTPMEISLDDYATDAENTSPDRIACYNSAGEYKIFALGDLAPA